MASWSFLTTHARVLLTIAGDPDSRLRDIAAVVGVTERRVYEVVTDLVESGYLIKHRVGRRNRYEIRAERQINDGVIDLTVGDVIELLIRTSDASGTVDDG